MSFRILLMVGISGLWTIVESCIARHLSEGPDFNAKLRVCRPFTGSWTRLLGGAERRQEIGQSVPWALLQEAKNLELIITLIAR